MSGSEIKCDKINDNYWQYNRISLGAVQIILQLHNIWSNLSIKKLVLLWKCVIIVVKLIIIKV